MAVTAAFLERRLNELLHDDPRPWFHGGIAGLKPGNLVLPSIATGVINLAGDRRYVYVTDCAVRASYYAKRCPGGGTIYVVEPIGLLSLAPETVRRLRRRYFRGELPEWLVKRERPQSARCSAACVVEAVRSFPPARTL